MKTMFVFFGLGFVFGGGATIGALMAWMILPSGKGLKEEQAMYNARIEKLLQAKVDAVLAINDTLKGIAERK